MKGFLFIALLFSSLVSLWAAPRYVIKESKRAAPLLIASVQNDQAGPFVKVSFDKAPDLGFELYAQQVSVGTSGLRFNYFAKTNNGFEPLGEFPELLYDSESGLWVSHEKDGTRVLRTIYQIKGKSITIQSEEIIQ